MRRRLGARAAGVFVAALERGGTVEAAADEAGFAPSSFYRLRRRDEGFAGAWDAAVAKSAGVVLIACANKRALQKRRTRRVRFTRERKEAFLAHFAATCDATASAEAAGVCRSTVDKHVRIDPAFAEAWDEALQAGYRALEAEMLAEALQRREGYRVAPKKGVPRPSFDQALKLLDRYTRRGGEVGPRRRRPEADRRWSFDDAIAALEKRLRVVVGRNGAAAGEDGRTAAEGKRGGFPPARE